MPRRDHLPLYVQIRQNIEQDLLRSRIRPGDRLPSEDELAARYTASRMTVRRAIDQLVSQGRLKRIQGHGTFVVAPAKPETTGVSRWSIARIEHNSGVKTQVVRVQETTPTPRIANLLHVMPGETIIEITLLLTKDKIPLGYEIDRIPKLLVPTIDRWDLGDQTLYSFLTQRCSLEFGRVHERIRAVQAEEEAAEILGVDPGSPLLYVDGLVFLNSGIPVVLTETYYLGDKYSYRGFLKHL